jgi:hypothetical protein
VPFASPSTLAPAVQSRWTTLLLLSTLILALGGMLFGLDKAVPSGATASLITALHLMLATLSFTASSAIPGTIVGVMLTGLSVCKSLWPTMGNAKMYFVPLGSGANS